MTVNEASNTIGGQSRSTFAGTTGVGGVNRVKDDYLEAFEDHVHTGVKIMSKLAKKIGTLAGKRSLTSIMDSYPQSMGHALFEDSDMPTPSTGTYFNPEVITRYMFGRLRWTWAVEQLARAGQRGVWKAPRAEDMRTGRIQFEINMARMAYLGPLQPLGTCTGDTNGNPTTTLYGRDDRTEAGNSRWKFGKHYLRKNMSLANIAASGGNVDALGPIAAGTAAERFVKAFDLSTPTRPTFTVAATPDPSAADSSFQVAIGDNTILVPWGSRRNANNTDSASFDSDLAGINGLFNLAVTSSYKNYVLGVARTSYPTMEGWVFNNAANANAARPYDDGYIELARDTIEDDGTGDDPNLIMMHKSLRREYIKSKKPLQLFPAVLGKRGFEAKLEFQAGDTPLTIETDRDCPPGLAWILDTNSFGWFSEADIQEVDDGERFVANKAAHEIVIVKSGNLACKKPHNNALVGDLLGSVSDLTAN